MPLRAIKRQLTCPIEFTSGSALIGRNGILVIPRNHLDLQNAKNKASLADALSEEWSILVSQLLKDNTKLVLGGGFQDREKSAVIEGGMHSVECENLSCNHEEADTRIILHAKNASITHDRIIIWSPDTDVFVFAMSLYHQIRKQLWFQTEVKDNEEIHFHSFHSREAWYTPLQIIASYPCFIRM